MGASRIWVVLPLLVLPSLAQTPHFGTVVIKPSTSSAPGENRLRVLPSGELIGHSISVVELIALAYAVPTNPSPRLASLPDWAVRQRFDIEARVLVPLRLEAKDIPTQRRTIEILVQELLRDHFGLVLRVKSASTPVYALRLSGKGQKLTRSTINPMDCILDTDSDGCHSFAIAFGHPLNARAVDLSDLAQYLENWTDRPVVDRTGTTGLFMMHSQGWQPMNLPPPPPGASGTGAEFANLPTLSAVLSSFGLQLLREESNLSFYAVKHIDRPNGS